MSIQGYVTDELTHFVGRGFESEEIQFETLVKIIKSGCVKSPHRRCDDPAQLTDPTTGVIQVNDIVCFCDIPLKELGIHISKYSRFGISFRKEFLISNGANPVFYIMQDSRISPNAPDRTLFLEGLIQRLGFMPLNPRMDPEAALTLHIVRCFCKLVDPSKREDDPENFYMEREWRVFGNLKFELSDIYRIIVPQKYAQRLRMETAPYMGQVTFIEDLET